MNVFELDISTVLHISQSMIEPKETKENYVSLVFAVNPSHVRMLDVTYFSLNGFFSFVLFPKTDFKFVTFFMFTIYI